MNTESNTATPAEPRKPQAMQEFENLIERVASEATSADREYIADLINPEGTVRIADLTPTQAAVLYRDRQWRTPTVVCQSAGAAFGRGSGDCGEDGTYEFGPETTLSGILRWVRVAERWEFLCASF